MTRTIENRSFFAQELRMELARCLTEHAIQLKVGNRMGLWERSMVKGYTACEIMNVCNVCRLLDMVEVICNSFMKPSRLHDPHFFEPLPFSGYTYTDIDSKFLNNTFKSLHFHLSPRLNVSFSKRRGLRLLCPSIFPAWSLLLGGLTLQSLKQSFLSVVFLKD